MSKKPLICVVLAAGQGTRMKSDTDKVLHELAGLPMIAWLLKTLEALEPEKIIVVTAPDAKAVQGAVKPHTIAIQPEANGTGGALKAALPELEGFEGDVLVTLGDAPLVKLQTFQDLIKTRAGAAMTVLGAIMDNATGYGRLVLDENGIVQKIVEEKDASDEEKQIQLVNTGVMCIQGKNLAQWLDKVEPNNAQNEYYLTDLPGIAAQDRKITTVLGTLDPSEVQGCNTRADLAALEFTLQYRLRYDMMESGVTMLNPATVYLHHDTNIAPGVVIEPNVYFGPGVTIKEGVRIKAFSHIENTTIAKDATIGPFARMRGGAEIGENAKIGTFVEVKKSVIGTGSSVAHLSYVGDCVMGENVTVGAGAITANYDGFEKHQTLIGEGVIVGANVNLIAPVSIDKGAFVAAGSTITKDVPSNALSISRAETKTREGWAAEYRKRKKKKKAS